MEATTLRNRKGILYLLLFFAVLCAVATPSVKAQNRAPVITITGGAGVTEGTPARFTVTLDAPTPAGGLTLRYRVADDGTADYVAPENEDTQTTTVNTATTSATITVPTTTDNVDEPDGAVTVTLLAGTGYTLGSPASAMVNVEDDDDPPVTLAFGAIAYTATEAGSNATVTVILNATPEREVVAPVTLTPVGEVTTNDYSANGVNGATAVTVRFAADASGAALTQTIIIAATDDGENEDNDESLALGFGAPLPSGVTTVNPMTATVILVDNKGSLLAEPRLIAATAMLRRHATRFESVTRNLVRDRLNHQGKRVWNFLISESESNGSVALSCSRKKRTGVCAWMDGTAVNFSGDAGGRQFDVYAGVDYFSENHVIGILASITSSELAVQEADYDTAQQEVGIYGGARLGGNLILDAAFSYAKSSSEVSEESEGQLISADFDSERFTLRAALTGSNRWAYGKGSLEIAPRTGILYIQEDLGSFRDNVGNQTPGENLQLGQAHLGPRLRWRHGGYEIVVEVPMKWDFQTELHDDANAFSAAIEVLLKFRLGKNLMVRLQGDYDGLGADTYESYGVGLAFDYLISRQARIQFSSETQHGALAVGLSLEATF